MTILYHEFGDTKNVGKTTFFFAIFLHIILPFTYVILKLNSFTLSHYGSPALLSTLTLDITTSEPRLDTGCWLDFTR